MEPFDGLDLSFGVVPKLAQIRVDLLSGSRHMAACPLAGPDLVHHLPERIVRGGLYGGLDRYQDAPLGHRYLVIQFQGAIRFDSPRQRNLHAHDWGLSHPGR